MPIDDLQQVQTIVFLMMENRSFDHALGHLSLEGTSQGNGPPVAQVEGLQGEIAPDGRLLNDAYANDFAGLAYYPFQMKDGPLPFDLPHDRDSIALQLARSPIDDRPTMSGFVGAYYRQRAQIRTRSPEPMGFLPASETPVSSFLARQYAVCDHWFASLPTDTHPNRLMALSGYSRIEKTGSFPLPDHRLLLDWLSERGIRWRVYRNGLSFFALLPRWLDDLALGRNFRSVRSLERDVLAEPDSTFPQVIIVEPSYLDSPVHLGDAPNDNHPPLGIAPGEAYLWRIYMALMANPRRWSRTVFVALHDEHGGFYDHVPPLPIANPAPAGESYPDFASTGVRVPALLISPFVSPGTVYSEPLDHTSILQFLAERFEPGGSGYSEDVNRRRAQGIRSVSGALDRVTARTDLPVPPVVRVPGPPDFRAFTPPETKGQMAFMQAAYELRERPGAMQTHPELMMLP
jgi:phospholipase C